MIRAMIRAVQDKFRPRGTDRITLGRRGEKLARKFLQKQGYRLLQSNYNTVGGEIDLVMRDDNTIVFVEVKTRRSEKFATAESAVNYRKQKHLISAARKFINTYRFNDHPCRFDVVAIVAPENGKPIISHYQNAFRPRR
ncbi:MAG: YraN family protein [Sedimentisphaerales bacterium]|nr:YraN family protein [Sedimentisphaerales bacterium]